MKKFLAFALVLICVIAIILPSIAAQTATVTITPNKTSAFAGDSVTFTVKVTGVSAAKSIGIIPSYDTSIFELVSGEWLISGSALSDFSGGTATIAYASARKFNENVFKFTLRLKSNAKLGSSSVNANVNIKNGSEAVACNVSSAKITIACNHKFSSWSNINATSHTRTCSTCGEKETKNHTFNNACDYSCNDCSFTRVINHDYQAAWSSDANQHWHVCSKCGDKKDVESHIPGSAATEYNNQVCTVCEYILQTALGHTHTPSSTYTYDETGHWLVCEGCKEPLEKIEHTFDTACDDTCDTCQYKRDITHTYSIEWSSDESFHWHTCILCNAREEEIAHIWDQGEVTQEPTLDTVGKRIHKCEICKQQYTVELILQPAPAQSPSPIIASENNKFSFISLLIGLGAGLVFGLGCGIIFHISKSKKTK